MQQLEISSCYPEDVDSLSDILELNGAVSVTFTDKYDDPILEPDIGTTPLWPNVTIHALFMDSEQLQCAMQILTANNPELQFCITEVPNKDWERICVDDFKPQRFGKKLWVCPSWVTPPEPDAVNIILDPGLAFGTGTHATTALCLTWLEGAKLNQKTVIDYGCGSGILSIAALKLGALHVDAVDIDPQALLATKNNATNNHISASQLSIDCPDNIKKPVNIIVANILLTPLIQLKQRFRKLLCNNGQLVVSGLLEEQVPELIDAYKDEFVHQETSLQDGWALIVFSIR